MNQSVKEARLAQDIYLTRELKAFEKRALTIEEKAERKAAQKRMYSRRNKVDVTYQKYQKEYQKKYRKESPDKQKNYYKENSGYYAEYRANHKEYQAEYYKKNRDKQNTYSKEYYRKKKIENEEQEQKMEIIQQKVNELSKLLNELGTDNIELKKSSVDDIWTIEIIDSDSDVDELDL